MISRIRCLIVTALACLLILGIFHVSIAQNIDQIDQFDFSNIRADNLTGQQITQFINQMQQAGYTTDQAMQIARIKGMPPAEITRLKQRVDSIQNMQVNRVNQGADTSVNENNIIAGTDTTRLNSNDSLHLMLQALDKLRPHVFGEELFNNPHLTFEPNLYIPVPKDYRVGPNDELLLEIYGYSQATYHLTISNEGAVNIPGVGVIYISGMTMEAATQKIRSKLAAVYSGIRSGNTQVNVSLGRIRSIRITLIGEIKAPGTYTLPSLATVFNALYASGGPNENGSMRQIEVIRNNTVIDTVDVYRFLLHGDQSDNIHLQDQDVIRVPDYTRRVEITGEVKRPGIYETLPGEHLQDVISFAGGFTNNAYTANIKAFQKTGTQKRIQDIPANEFAAYSPLAGDSYLVSSILNRFQNRVTISGAVYRPGQYELSDTLTLKGLIAKADGLREDAFLQRGSILRLKPDLTTEMIQFNVADIVKGTVPDIPLKREDEITIFSLFDLRGQYQVNIDGAVREPGTYAYADSMTLEDIIMKAGGFLQGANPSMIEIARRVYNSDPKSVDAAISHIFTVSVDKDLSFHASRFVLQPFDIIEVREEPGYQIQQQVCVEGEVVNPGTYTISNKSERISDLLKRAGGLTDLAYPKGAYLKRTYKTDRDLDNEKLFHLQQLQKSVNNTKLDTAALEYANDYVGIALDEILQNPAGRQDLFLQNGDVLTIPKVLQTVQVSGEVLYPNTTTFLPGRRLKYYLSEAGGFSSDAKKGKTFVIYANGGVKQTHHILFFRSYPPIDPGSHIFVPQKPQRSGLSAQQVVGVASGVASLTAVIITIISLLK